MTLGRHTQKQTLHRKATLLTVALQGYRYSVALICKLSGCSSALSLLLSENLLKGAVKQNIQKACILCCTEMAFLP